MSGECSDDNTITRFDIYLGDLTSVPTLSRSKRLPAGFLSNRYVFEQHQLFQEHILNTDGDPKTYTAAVNSRFSK